jgi:hypothetical protein
MMNHSTIGVFKGHTHPQQLQNFHLLAWGVVVHQFDASARSARPHMEYLGGHSHRWQPWLAMVVLVDVGRWRLTSDQPTVGIVKLSTEVFYYSYVDPIHS